MMSNVLMRAFEK